MYSLIYIERPKKADTQGTLNGPFCFSEKKEAIEKVFGYVSGRVLDSAEFFIESHPALEHLAEELEDCTEEEITLKVKIFLESITEESVMEDISDWYFEYANDELVEAYYSVNSFDAPVETSLCFTLRDETTGPEGDVLGSVSAKQSLGLSISVKGYSDCSSNDDHGTLVYVEKYDNKVQVRIYGDINSEEPSHNISLEGARNDLRVPE